MAMLDASFRSGRQVSAYCLRHLKRNKVQCIRETLWVTICGYGELTTHFFLKEKPPSIPLYTTVLLAYVVNPFTVWLDNHAGIESIVNGEGPAKLPTVLRSECPAYSCHTKYSNAETAVISQGNVR